MLVQWWQQLLLTGGVALAVIGLITWLVRQLVITAQTNAAALVAAAELKADQMIAAASKAADDRVHDSDLRADEWKQTAGVFEKALRQQRDITQKALEVNQMTDRYFGSIHAVVPIKGDNQVEVTGA